MFATAARFQPPSGPARLSTSQVRRNEGSPASRLKTLAYLDNVLARAEAQAAGADEALMLNTRGDVACASAANLFWIADGRLYTPALDCGVLAGVMRGRVIAAAARFSAAVAEVRVGLDALAGAEAAFLTNSLIGVRPIQALDGRLFAESPLAARLASAV
jgi:branched-chain amino acid aminotransferase/4-amino-4-deoxychorismate lyase